MNLVKDTIFKIENFEGPLDLLLFLVKNKKKEINDISILEIVNQFLDLVNNKKLDFEISSEYLSMAASLINIKSKFFLPKKYNLENLTEEEYQKLEEDKIVQRIIEYEKFKRLSRLLMEEKETSDKSYTKKYEKNLINELKPNNDLMVKNISNLNSTKLIEAALNLIEKKKNDVYNEIRISKHKISVEQRKIELDNFFNKNINKDINFINLFDFYDTYYISITLLIILEYVRWNNFVINQDRDNNIFIKNLNKINTNNL